jgi:hypothetical protein
MDEFRSMNCCKTVRDALGKRDKFSDAARSPFAICDGLNDLGKRPRIGCTCEDREPFAIPLEKIDYRQDVRVPNLCLQTTGAPQAV